MELGSRRLRGGHGRLGERLWGAHGGLGVVDGMGSGKVYPSSRGHWVCLVVPRMLLVALQRLVGGVRLYRASHRGRGYSMYRVIGP